MLFCWQAGGFFGCFILFELDYTYRLTGTGGWRPRFLSFASQMPALYASVFYVTTMIFQPFMLIQRVLWMEGWIEARVFDCRRLEFLLDRW